MSTLTLEDILSKTSDLPTMPAATVQVLRELDREESSAQSVATYMQQDPALSARVLRLANSAFYGTPTPIMRVGDAIMLLGNINVRNLCLVASTYAWMTKPLPGYDLGPGKLWEHSFAVAVGAELIANETRSAEKGHAFTAGLLHNLGKLAMSVWLENKLQAIQLLAERDDLSFDETERRVFGFDHAQVGAHLGEKWNLPKPLVDAMRFHHNPDACDPTSSIVDCVHVADYLASSLGYGLGGDGLRYYLAEGSLTRLKLNADILEGLCEPFTEEYDRFMKLFHEKDAA
ncbi:MAG: HDOD domain-containing protein [Armatimonadetes bacterium]|nr:HDOD domain-containing protein [Armatimonadota bacterium]